MKSSCISLKFKTRYSYFEKKIYILLNFFIKTHICNNHLCNIMSRKDFLKETFIEKLSLKGYLEK